jgi:hypothetical protein
MAKRPEPDKNAVLCTTCDKQVVKNEKKEWVHANARVNSHEVIKTIKYSDWAAKYNADRTIVNKEGVAVKGPNVKKPAMTAKERVKFVEDQTKKIGLPVPRRSKADVAAIRAENEADRVKAAAELQARQDAMEEAWSQKRGYHIPSVLSREPVVRPSTGEIYRPSTGEVIHQMDPSSLPPKLGSPERDKLNESLNHVHEDHPWVPVLGEDGTIARSPVITNVRNHFGGMTNWAHMLKRKRDPNNEFEYKVWRAEPVANNDYRGLPYGVRDITRTNRYQWRISARQRYCEKCAPTITLPTGSVKPNPVKSVDRPPMEELAPPNKGLGDTTMRDVIGLYQARAGGGTGRGKQRKPLEKWQEAFGVDTTPPAE